MTAALSHLDVTVLNRARLDWKSEWKRDRSFNPRWGDQAKWVLDGLEAADVIAIYFARETAQAKDLMELELWARSERCVVGYSQGYSEEEKVRVICERFDIECVASVEDFGGRCPTEARHAKPLLCKPGY
jgi:hypothetical protein